VVGWGPEGKRSRRAWRRGEVEMARAGCKNRNNARAVATDRMEWKINGRDFKCLQEKRVTVTMMPCFLYFFFAFFSRINVLNCTSFSLLSSRFLVRAL